MEPLKPQGAFKRLEAAEYCASLPAHFTGLALLRMSQGAGFDCGRWQP